MPSPDLPELRSEDPGSAAASIRRHWGLGFRPIPNLIRLMESKGVRVFTLSEGKNVDAFSFWRDGTPFIFLNTLKSAERSRFDAAHELGHLLMHSHGYPEGREVEKEADSFASHLLMPREDVLSQLLSCLVISVSQFRRSWLRYCVATPRHSPAMTRRSALSRNHDHPKLS
jgi:hypothetical protein